MIAIVCLLGLQALWLYNTYQLHLTKVKDSTNKIFVEALEKEMMLRLGELGNDQKTKPENKGEMVEIATIDGSVKDEEASSFFFHFTQIALYGQNIPINLIYLDSIYSSMLNKAEYPVKYQIIYTDSINTVIEAIGQKITKGFETDIIPIVNGTKVQAVVSITFPVVIRNMIAVLMVSLLMILFIFVCLIYDVKIYRNEKYMALLRENFTQAFTHDLKTPLSSIHSVLTQLSRGALDKKPETKNKFIAIAIEQSLNLQAMVNRILTIAYINKKEIAIDKEPVDLPQIIQSLINKYSVNREKSVEFHAVYDLKDEIVYADSLHLTNAISNLFDNAIKYSGNSVRIDIACKVVDKNVHIKIKDNGFGISKNDQLKIFDQFERGAEIKRNSAGLGTCES